MNKQKIISTLIAGVLGVSGSSLALAGGGKAEWYVKTHLQVDGAAGEKYVDNFSGVFGRLNASSDGYDQHDIPAYTSTVGNPAALVFIHGSDWGEHEGEYLTDYHDTKGKTDSWPFTVFSNLEGAEVTLTWEGLFELEAYQDGELTRYNETLNTGSGKLGKLHLIDLQSNQVVDAVSGSGELNEYKFTMGASGNRQFMWVLGPIKGSYFETNKQVMKYIRQQQRAASGNAGNGNGSGSSNSNGVTSQSSPSSDPFGLPPGR